MSSAVRFTTRHVKAAIALYNTGLGCPSVKARLRARFGDPSPSEFWIRRVVRAAGLLRSTSRALELRWMRETGRDYDRLRPIALSLSRDRDLSLQQIADELGVSPNFARQLTVYARRRRAEELEGEVAPATLSNPKAFGAWRRAWLADTPETHARRERVARCAELYLEGKSYQEISAATGAPVGSIVKHLQSAGITPNRQPRKQGALR